MEDPACIWVRFTDRLIKIGIPNDLPLTHQLSSSVGFFKTRWLSCLMQPEELLERIIRFRPSVISEYPSALAQVANLILASNHKLMRPRLIITVGETLTTT